MLQTKSKSLFTILHYYRIFRYITRELSLQKSLNSLKMNMCDIHLESMRGKSNVI
jgi:hypothetical protein